MRNIRYVSIININNMNSMNDPKSKFFQNFKQLEDMNFQIQEDDKTFNEYIEKFRKDIEEKNKFLDQRIFQLERIRYLINSFKSRQKNKNEIQEDDIFTVVTDKSGGDIDIDSLVENEANAVFALYCKIKELEDRLSRVSEYLPIAKNFRTSKTGKTIQNEIQEKLSSNSKDKYDSYDIFGLAWKQVQSSSLSSFKF